ncbi:hypothetical protein GCM10008905_06360 [Clostridium malenominatum]|uniref:DUF3784 domain-containing protein n=1 Tax=Clostridium malenominatum TaxID=1539 RepID=A0ABP3TZJ3_9CLOT
MARTIVGVVYIIVAIWGGIFIFNNRNNIPLSIHGLNKENYEVINKVKLNKIMLIQDTLSCLLFLLAGVLCITYKRVSAVGLPSFFIFINIIFSKVAKKYISIK